MKYFTNEFLNFFKELEENNHKEWFHENKTRYEKHVKEPFKLFVDDLIEASKTIDKNIAITSKDAIFRINRDIRFSKDKAPYKTTRSAIISERGRKNHEIPGFYLEFSAERVMLGGGAYAVSKDSLYRIRQEISYNLKAFSRLIENEKFKSKYGEIRGEKNKIIPKEFKKEAEEQKLIFNKNFYYMAELPAETILNDNLIGTCLEYFEAGHELNEFLKGPIKE